MLAVDPSKNVIEARRLSDLTPVDPAYANRHQTKVLTHHSNVAGDLCPSGPAASLRLRLWCQLSFGGGLSACESRPMKSASGRQRTSRIMLARAVRREANAMNPLEEEHALQIARVLGDPVRFSIYRRITEANEVRCGDICAGMSVRASTVSHHLKKLSDAGLVESRRERQAVYYRWDPSTLEAYLDYLGRLAQKRRTPEIEPTLLVPALPTTAKAERP